VAEPPRASCAVASWAESAHLGAVASQKRTTPCWTGVEPNDTSAEIAIDVRAGNTVPDGDIERVVLLGCCPTTRQAEERTKIAHKCRITREGMEDPDHDEVC